MYVSSILKKKNHLFRFLIGIFGFAVFVVVHWQFWLLSRISSVLSFVALLFLLLQWVIFRLVPRIAWFSALLAYQILLAPCIFAGHFVLVCVRQLLAVDVDRSVALDQLECHWPIWELQVGLNGTHFAHFQHGNRNLDGSVDWRSLDLVEKYSQHERTLVSPAPIRLTSTTLYSSALAVWPSKICLKWRRSGGEENSSRSFRPHVTEAPLFSRVVAARIGRSVNFAAKRMANTTRTGYVRFSRKRPHEFFRIFPRHFDGKCTLTVEVFVSFDCVLHFELNKP